MKFARAILKALALAVWTGTLIPVQALAVALRLPIEERVPMLYHRGVARILGMKVIAIGQRVSARPALFVVNHSSWLDITVIDTLMPICFVAKREVNSWPVFGLLARLQMGLLQRQDVVPVKLACLDGRKGRPPRCAFRAWNRKLWSHNQDSRSVSFVHLVKYHQSTLSFSTK